MSKFDDGEQQEQYTLPFNAVRYLGERLKEIAKKNAGRGFSSSTVHLPDDVLF